jgi:hypothetical protein
MYSRRAVTTCSVTLLVFALAGCHKQPAGSLEAYDNDRPTDVGARNVRAEDSTQCTQSAPGSPCYADDGDILDGNWTLLPDQDLLLSYADKSPGFSSQIFLTSNTTISNTTQVNSNGKSRADSTPQPVVAVGHFGESANQGAATFYSDTDKLTVGVSYDATTQNNRIFTSAAQPCNGTCTPQSALAGDFDHDGYDELVLIYTDASGTFWAQFFSASDPTQETPGIVAIGAPTSIGKLSIPGRFILPTAVGDLDGDGNFDLVIAQQAAPFSLLAYAIVPNDGTFGLSPQNSGKPITISSGLTLNSTNSSVSLAPFRAMSMAVGEFDGDSTSAELVLAYLTECTSKTHGCDDNGGTEYTNAIVADVSRSWVISALAQQRLYDSYLEYSCGWFCTEKGPLWTTNVQVKTGRFNYNSINDNAVVLISLKSRDPKYLTVDHKDGPTVLWALRAPLAGGKPTFYWDRIFRSTSGQTFPSTTGGTNKFQCMGDIAIGRFDPPSTTVNGVQTADFSLQLAIAGSSAFCDQDGSGSVGVGIYTVNVDNANVTPVTLTAKSSAFLTSANPAPDVIEWDPWPTYTKRHIIPLALNAQDTQGRSVQLGQPTVTRLHKREPNFIVESPAMHADWLGGASQGPDPACDSSSLNPPCFFNISLEPSQFYTTYTGTNAASVSYETKATSSWSVGTKETFDMKVSYGIPEVDMVSFETKQSLSYTYTGTATLDNTLNQSVSRSIDTQTGIGDVVSYIDYWQNIYTYPVLNQYVCPADQPDCSPSQELPLVVNYAAPDTVNYYYTDGSTEDWYQPVHEPGNIFSYPCSVDAATETYGDGGATQSKLSADTSWWYNDTTQTTLTLGWAQNTGQSQSVGTNNQFATDFSETVTEKVGPGMGADFISGALDINGSGSFGTLTTSSRTTSKTTNIGVIKPAFSVNVQNNYRYGFNAVILGVQSTAVQMPGYQTLPAYPDTQGYQTDPQVETGGPLAIRYLADPSAGGTTYPFWKTYYGDLPDIAINRPRRFQETDGVTDDYSLIPQAPTGSDPYYPVDYGFYAMKGLFVTSQSDQSLPMGPSLETATDGDLLTVWARVYNFSLAKLPSGAVVKARFFRQELDNSKGQLVAGTLTQIGDDVKLSSGVDPFPNQDVNGMVCSAQSQNWEMAKVDFDTDGLGGSIGMDYLFWVVVWMEDASGQVLAERSDHGMQGSFDPKQTYSDLTKVPVEGHSNNVGLFNLSFHVFPLTQQEALAQSTAGQGDVATVQLTDFASGATRVNLGEQTMLSVKSVAGDRAVGSHSVYFYDRQEGAEGGSISRAFGSEKIVHIGAGRSHLARVSYLPESCGVHTLVAKVEPEQWQQVETSLQIEVELAPASAIVKTKTIISRTAVSKRSKSKLLAKLDASQKAFEAGDAAKGLKLYDEYKGLLGKELGGTSSDLYRYLSEKHDVLRACIVQAAG